MADNTDDLIISISTDQATLRRSIKRIEQDLSGLAGSVQRQFATVGKSIDNSVTSSMQNRINAMVGIGTRAANEWSGALADQGKELERLARQPWWSATLLMPASRPTRIWSAISRRTSRSSLCRSALATTLRSQPPANSGVTSGSGLKRHTRLDDDGADFDRLGHSKQAS